MSDASRRWMEIGVRSVSAGDADVLLADGLLDLGGRAVEEREGWYITHLTEPADPDRFLADARDRIAQLTGLEDVEVRFRWQAHEEWAETWKRGLAPRRITSRLIVRPSWTDFVAGPGDCVIVIDPGMAFGTAEHGTTRGCLRLIDRTVGSGDRVLDVGAGSGILSIAAAMLGAADVLAIEGDPLACEALDENVASNGVGATVRCSVEWADAENLVAWGPVDGIIANIESGVLRPLLHGFHASLKPVGWLVLSGILDHEWSALRAETEGAGFVFVTVDEDGEWRSGLFRRCAESTE